jgi:hypothetical protein
VANAVGERPSGRYGHTISTIGSRVYIFGGQLDDYFFDDLICYDLTTLRSASAAWQSTIPAGGASPPPRTNHSMVTFQDRLYLFGGTDGKLWYSDTWCYDPVQNAWTLLDCSGFIPAPCEGHAATIVGDVMYVFGGRSSQGKDLGILSALKISTRKWFTFQNLGPGPTPRSGHSLTAFGNHKILVMGGESPDLAPVDDYNEQAKSSTVFVLDTSRINYPPDTETRIPGASKLHQPSAAAAPSPDPTALQSSALPRESPDHLDRVTSPSSQTYPVTQSSVDDRATSETRSYSDEVEEESKSNTTFDSVEERLVKSQNSFHADAIKMADVPGSWQPSEDSSEQPPLVVKKTRSSTEVLAPTDEISAVTTSEQPVDQSTPGDSDLMIVDEEERVSSISEAMERLKASNSWYESELAAAREQGYVPRSAPPVDVLKLRRVSQILTHDNEESLSEREILLAALSELKEELHTVQLHIQEQAEAASARISQAEQERDDALKEVEELKAKLEGSDDEQLAALQKELEETKQTNRLLLGDVESLSAIDSLKSDNLNLEKQLRSQTDRLVIAEHEVSQLRSKLEMAESNSRDLSSAAADKVTALEAAGAAMVASDARVSELNRQLDQHRDTRTSLENEVQSLKTELADSRQKLEVSERDLGEHRQLLQTTNEQVEHSSRALNDGVQRVVSLWAASKAFGAAANDVSNGELEEDTKYSELERKLELTTQLHETHKEAADKATTQLTQALEQLSLLKRELANSETSKQALEREVASTKEDIETIRGDLERHQSIVEEREKTLGEMTAKHGVLESKISEQNKSSTDLEEAIKQREEQACAKQAELDAKVKELEAAYAESLGSVRNTDKALSRTRDELNKQKDLNGKLQAELDDLRLHTQTDDDDRDGERISSASPYNNKHVDLQLRDLRAQVIILQEERDELRASTLELKKKAINNAHDIEDAQREVRRLTEENANLLARTKDAEDLLAAALEGRNGHDPVIDPESGESLEAYSKGLDEVRTNRERLSGLLHSNPLEG